MNTNSKIIKKIEKLTGAKLSLGNFISAIRQGENWSQTQLAEMLGVSRQFVCDLEHGRRMLSPKMAEAFALKLGYSAKQFIRLCLQEMLDKQGLHYDVEVKAA